MRMFESDPETTDLVAGIHTFSVVRNPARAGPTYLGYAGPVYTGRITVWGSEDLRDWQRRDTVSGGTDFRWPSVVYDGEFYMAVRERDHTVGERVKATADTLVPGYDYDEPTHISLYRSDDGVAFAKRGTLVRKGNLGRTLNQNPFLFADPVSGDLKLFYYSGSPTEPATQWEIRACSVSPDATDLSDEDSLVAAFDEVVAAPGVFYHPTAERYVLFVEHKVDGDWHVRAFHGDDVLGPYTELDASPILRDDVGCPFPYLDSGTLHLFASQRTGGDWVGKVYRYELGALV